MRAEAATARALLHLKVTVADANGMQLDAALARCLLQMLAR